MIVIIEDADYIEALRPFNNGCSFKLAPENHASGKPQIMYGCYLLQYLVQGAELVLMGRVKAAPAQRLPIDVSAETLAILRQFKCRHCGDAA